MNKRFDPMTLFVEDRMEEVVIVPCGGCAMGQIAPEDLASLSAEAVCVSMSSVLAGVAMSKRRLELAHAVIGVSACEEACVHKLLRKHRAPDFHLDATKVRGPGGWVGLVQRQIESLCEPEDETDIHWITPEVPAAVPIEEPIRTEQLDFRGMVCPMPIIKLSNYCRDPQAERLEVLADDRAFPADLQAWCRQKEATLVDLVQEGKEYKAIVSLGPRRRASRELPAAEVTAPPPGTSLPLLERIDCMSLRSPLQIVELQKALLKYDTPGTLIVFTRDAQFVEDVEHWCRQSDAVLLQLSQTPELIEAEIAIHLQSTSVASELQVDMAGVDIRETSQQMPVIPPPQSTAEFTNQVREPMPLGVLNPEQVLDYTGLRCPMPIVRLTQVTRQSTNKLFQILADDQAFPQDLRAWCEQHEYEVLSIETVGRRTEALIAKPGSSLRVSEPSLDYADATLSSPSTVRRPIKGMRSGSPGAPASPWISPVSSNDDDLMFKETELQERIVGLTAANPPQIPLPIQKGAASISSYGQSLREALTSSQPKPAAPTHDRAILGHQPEDLAQIRTGEVLQVRSFSGDQDFASSGKQVVRLDAEAKEDKGSFADLTTNPKLPRLSLGQNGASFTPQSRETSEFSLSHGPRLVQDLLPQGVADGVGDLLASEPALPEVIDLDLTGLKCPLPIVRLAARVRQDPNATFSIQADDAAFPPDLRAWCSQSKMTLHSLETNGRVHSAILGPTNGFVPVVQPSLPPGATATRTGSAGDGAALFEELQAFSFWETDLPTKPVPQMMMKETRELDLRGFNAMGCIDQLKLIPDDSNFVYRILIDATISMDNFQMLCELNHFSCIAADPGEQFGEIWLQRALSGL